MVLRQLALCVVAAAGLMAFQVSHAQPVRACPDGQAVQALHPNGTPVRCVPVPPPVDVNGALAAERAAREGADATLNQLIMLESDARKAADDELRASINETKISGRYAFSGTQICLSSTFGFNDDLTPRGTTDPTRAAVVAPSTSYTSGFRTFNDNGTGTAGTGTVEISTQTVSHPTMFVTSTGFAGVGTNGPGRPSGNASSSTQTGTFTWEVREGKLFINDASAAGPFSSGPNNGCTVRTDNVPPIVGVLAKDLRTISVVHDGVAVESLTITCAGVIVSSNPRICHRQRLLQKM